KILFRKAFPNVAYPLSDGENLFIMDVYNALQNHSSEVKTEHVVEPESQPQPQPQPQPAPEQESEPEEAGESASEADQEADKALEYLKSVPEQFTSRDLTVISAELDHVQEAANALISAGRYDENEATVGAAVDYLINILAEIQQGGV
ncbi:TPA: head protein, partial [Escherichia coli]|nr:head protein [Escherichia coli]